MKKIKLIPIIALVIIFAAGFSACKKVKDADLKTAISAAFAANEDLSGLTVEVKEKIATLTGEVKDDATLQAAISLAKTIKGVKDVASNITVKPPAPIVSPADQALEAALKDALKDNAGVMATVKDGEVTLTGEIKKSQLVKLMQKVSALKPAKINNQLTVK